MRNKSFGSWNGFDHVSATERNKKSNRKSGSRMRRITKEYVVLGAGSAGCVLSRRLTQAGRSVALVEAGRWDSGRWDSWTIQMPAALTYSVADKRYNWGFETVPQKNLAMRRIQQPRGKVLGGSSSINAMAYVRGNPLDYERWENEDSIPGWGFKDVLPYFKRAQNFKGHAPETNQEMSPYRGYDGPLKVTNYETPKTRTNVLFNVLEEAGIDAGYNHTKDPNGFMQEGFGPYDMSVDPDTGKRCSTAAAYLHPALKENSDKLHLETETLVLKVLFHKDSVSGKSRAIGVKCENTKTGEVFEIMAEKEVILSLGAVGSPHLLMLSGIGDTEHLQKNGVNEIIHHNAEVGANLQDHLEVYLQYLCKLPVSLYPYASWTLRYFHKRIAIGIEWFLGGTGICASNQFETGAFIRSDKGVKYPDIQYHFIPGCVVGQLDFLPHHGFQIHVGTLRPTSRGTIRLASNDPKEAPLIDPNFFDTQKDRDDMRKAVRLADEVIQQPAFEPYKGRRLAPEPDVKSDAEIHEWIQNSSHSAYHLSCTCAMGKVVDSNGKVFGVDGLRVVDASIMPTMTSGNLNAPTIMIAEKIAANLANTELPPDPQPFYVHPNWETQQR